MKDLSNWTACARPGLMELQGQYVLLKPYTNELAVGLFAAIGGDENKDLWDYVPVGPFSNASELSNMLANARDQLGWQTMVLINPATGKPLGMASFMRIREAHGSVEVGAVIFSKELQRTRSATEAIYLMAQHAFDGLGYRRFEWKCNNANAASKRAAERFGFTFEGIFRNDMVVKGQNRDTAWYAMIDADWEAIGDAFEAWLDAQNFDVNSRQINKLATLRAA